MGIVFFFWREVLPLKFEIMRDGRPNLAGGKSRKLGVPVRPTVRISKSDSVAFVYLKSVI